MKNYAEALSIIDAKSVCDAVIRNGSSLKQDRRTAIDLAMARETLQQVQAMIRWCPLQPGHGEGESAVWSSEPRSWRAVQPEHGEGESGRLAFRVSFLASRSTGVWN